MARVSGDAPAPSVARVVLSRTPATCPRPLGTRTNNLRTYPVPTRTRRTPVSECSDMSGGERRSGVDRRARHRGGRRATDAAVRTVLVLVAGGESAIRTHAAHALETQGFSVA